MASNFEVSVWMGLVAAVAYFTLVMDVAFWLY